MVSVIIPNYNNQKWLRTCIESCLAQKEYLKEVIIVDDHSTDQSWSILKKIQTEYPKIIKIFKNPDKGANSARNYGFSKSTGSFIQWLDSDDSILPGKFEAQIKALNEKRADIAYSDWLLDYYVDLKKTSSELKKCKAHDDFLYQLLIDNWKTPNAYLIRRKLASRLADGIGWNPKTIVGQDREYFTMAAILGATFIYVNGTYAVHNSWSKQSISAKYSQKKRQEVSISLFKKFRKAIETYEKDKDKKKHYLKQIDTNILYSLVWVDSQHYNQASKLFRINWKSINGLKIKFLMLLKIFDVNTFKLANYLIK